MADETREPSAILEELYPSCVEDCTDGCKHGCLGWLHRFDPTPEGDAGATAQAEAE